MGFLGQDRFSILPSSFLSKRGIPVITVLTTAAITSSLAAEGYTQPPESFRSRTVGPEHPRRLHRTQRPYSPSPPA